MTPPRKNFPLRLSPALYAVLERWAADELRSVNAQLEYLLRDAAHRAGRLRPQVSEIEPESVFKDEETLDSPSALSDASEL